MPQLRKAGGTEHGHTGDLGQIVDAAVVRFAVRSHQTGAIHRQHHMEAVQRHILHQHIVTTLEEAVIYREDRQQPLLGHARGHGHRVTLRNAHIKKAPGMVFGKSRQPRTVRHGRRNGADAPVGGRQRRQLAPEHRGEGR